MPFKSRSVKWSFRLDHSSDYSPRFSAASGGRSHPGSEVADEEEQNEHVETGAYPVPKQAPDDPVQHVNGDACYESPTGALLAIVTKYGEHSHHPQRSQGCCDAPGERLAKRQRGQHVGYGQAGGKNNRRTCNQQYQVN